MQKCMYDTGKTFHAFFSVFVLVFLCQLFGHHNNTLWRHRNYRLLLARTQTDRHFCKRHIIIRLFHYHT